MIVESSELTATDALQQLLYDIERRADVEGSDAVHAAHTDGVANLADYLALRQQDLRDLQASLARLGVSSLGRCESHVRATVAAALRACAALAGVPGPSVDTEEFDRGRARLEANTAALLGPTPPDRSVRIMVTLPTEAADSGGELIAGLIDAGMDCARINTAHDDAEVWSAMIANVRKVAEAAGRPCCVLADLAGPEVRTGPLAEGPRAVRLRPVKDAIGRVERPGTALLVAADSPSPGAFAGPVVPVDGTFLAGLSDGDEIEVEEARGRHRTLRVIDVADAGATVEVPRTTWIRSGGWLHRAATGHRTPVTGVVGQLPARPSALRLAEGDLLTLATDLTPAPLPEAGEVAHIGCTLAEAVAALRPGHRVEFDDGAIGGTVIEVDHERGEALVRIQRVAAGGAKLRAEKGINLPDTEFEVPALSSADLDAIDSIGREIDAFALSFVRSPEDVHALHDALSARGIDVGVVIKIETVGAFRALPELLAAVMRFERAGVMIARGDLAVEAGFERTAELQEQILWACEAAHLPAIWATQVLESLAKDGQPSRAEITDAAMATRAECVMLNKGEHIDRAVHTLDDILRRMAGHQHKKATLLRQLRSW